MAKHTDADLRGLTFEQAYERLETTIEALDHGQLSLNDALASFEEGTRLVRYCEEMLKQAELRVQQLVSDRLGVVTLEPFEGEH